MLFTDDTVLCQEDKKVLEEALDIWRAALEKRSLKVRRSEAKYLRMGNDEVGDEELKLQGKIVKKV